MSIGEYISFDFLNDKIGDNILVNFFSPLIIFKQIINFLYLEFLVDKVLQASVDKKHFYAFWSIFRSINISFVNFRLTSKKIFKSYTG